MSESNSPAKKIRRVTLVTNSENQAPIVVAEVQQQLKSLQETSDNLQLQLNIVQGQLKVILESVCDTKAVVGKLLRQHYEDEPLQKQFPIKTEQELLKLNEKICPGNRNQYVKAMKSILETGGALKNLKYIIDDTVTMAYNVDEVHGKQSLKTLDNFYKALLDAISLLKDSQGPPEEQIRKAMQRQKKRQFKNKSVLKPPEAAIQTLLNHTL